MRRVLACLALTLFIFAGNARSQTTCDTHNPQDPPMDKDALIALYCATDGSNWTNNSNWLTESPLGGWYGVTLDNNGRVTRLRLPNNQMSGSIPTELGSLTGLTYLNFYSNQLSGSIPTALDNLTSLTILYLDNNQMSGSIPTELGSLTSLTELRLDNNQLSGSIPTELGSLTSLTELRLFNNQLSGSIPTELGNLTSLTILYLQNNQLSGSIPTELGSLTSLTGLYLYDNELSGSIPSELGNLGSLTKLWLYNNELSGSIPSELGNLGSLTELRLYNNNLSGSIPTELGNLTSLTILYLDNNQLSGSIPSELDNLTGLTDLWLHNNNLSGEIPDLNNLSLNYLYLHNNRLTGPVPEFTSATGHFRLSLYGNTGLYGYPAALDDRSLLRLLAPGDGSAVCLPSTEGGADCVIPTKVDNLRVQASGQQLVFSWVPNPANPAPSGYDAWYFPPGGPWTSASVTGTTATTPDAILSFLVRTTDASTSPRLYYIPGFSPLFTLSIAATPPCGTSVTDLSVVEPFPWIRLILDPPDSMTEAEYAGIDADGVQLTSWVNFRNEFPVYTSLTSVVQHYRRTYPSFAGFKFRLKQNTAVTAQCTWRFDSGNTSGTSRDTSPPNTGETDTGGGGGGGGGLPPSGSGDEPPPEDEEPSGPDQPDACGENDRENLERFYEASEGEDWHENENWNSPEPLGEWFGVQTDEDGNVISLRLSENNLSGEVPEELLLCLSELKEFALWGNDLPGEVPEELVLRVERAVLRDIAEMLNINPEWFENYGDPYNFEDWHEGVTTDDDGRVTELDLPGAEIPESVSQLKKLRKIMITSSGGGGCALRLEDNSSAFSLFLLALLVFAALGRKRARG